MSFEIALCWINTYKKQNEYNGSKAKAKGELESSRVQALAVVWHET